MTSVVTAPEPQLGSEENPHPFKKGERRIKDDIYFNSSGNKKVWNGKRFVGLVRKNIWTYDRVIEFLKNTKFTLVWSEKKFNDIKKLRRGQRAELKILIKHSCGCNKLRSMDLIKKSIKCNNYFCGSGRRGICEKLNGQTFNEDKTKKFCPTCKNMLLLIKFHYSTASGLYNSRCNECAILEAKKWREKTIENRLTACLRACKSSTNIRNKKGKQHSEVELDLEYLLELWEECNGECFRFKIKMSLLDGDVWLVSLDRIDSSKGYIKGNVQLVSWQYNLMKGNKTEEEMDKVFDQLKLVYSNTSL